jgi:hypothetical protein
MSSAEAEVLLHDNVLFSLAGVGEGAADMACVGGMHDLLLQVGPFQVMSP